MTSGGSAIQGLTSSVWTIKINNKYNSKYQDKYHQLIVIKLLFCNNILFCNKQMLQIKDSNAASNTEHHTKEINCHWL